MKVISAIVGVCVVAPFVTSCASFSPKEVGQPTSLTVESALTDVGRGFAGMKSYLRDNNLKLGLYPCKVTVNLNVTADAAQGGQLVLDASTAPAATATSTAINTFSASGNFTQTNSSSAHRGNTVVVEMYSAACTPKETLGGANPDKIAAAGKGMAQTVSDAVLSGSKKAAPGSVVVNPGKGAVLVTWPDEKKDAAK